MRRGPRFPVAEYAGMWRRQQERAAFAPAIRSGKGCRSISVIAVSDGFGLARSHGKREERSMTRPGRATELRDFGENRGKAISVTALHQAAVLRAHKIIRHT